MPGFGDSRSRIKQEISQAFKLNGFQLRVDASRHLEELLSEVEGVHERRHWIDKLLETLQRKDLESAVLDRQTLDKVIKVQFL